MNHVVARLDARDGLRAGGAYQIIVGGVRHKGTDLLDSSVVDERAHVGSADGRAGLLLAGDDAQIDAVLGEHGGQRFIIRAGCGGEGLLADIAAGEVQRLGNAGEERGVQIRMRAGDKRVVLEEVGGEGRRGNHL